MSAAFLAEREKLFSRLSEVTAKEFMTRNVITFWFAIVNVLYLTWIYSLLALVSVGTGMSPPAAWPPLFGSLSDASTLRGFWGYVFLASIILVLWYIRPKESMAKGLQIILAQTHARIPRAHRFLPLFLNLAPSKWDYNFEIHPRPPRFPHLGLAPRIHRHGIRYPVPL